MLLFLSISLSINLYLYKYIERGICTYIYRERARERGRRKEGRKWVNFSTYKAGVKGGGWR